MAKKKGGVGKKVTGIAKRRFFPNLQRVRLLVDGVRRTLRVCTKCLKAGKAQKVPLRREEAMSNRVSSDDMR